MVMEDSKKLDTLDKKLKKLEKDFKIREWISHSKRRSCISSNSLLKDAYAFIRIDVQRHGNPEHMIVLFMDHSNTITGYYRHSKGTINSTSVDIEVILAVAIKTLSKQ